MQFIRSYFTPLDEPPVYVGYRDTYAINNILQEQKLVNDVTKPQLISKTNRTVRNPLDKDAQLNMNHYYPHLNNGDPRIRINNTTIKSYGFIRMLQNYLGYRTMEFTAAAAAAAAAQRFLLEIELQKRRCLGAIIKFDSPHRNYTVSKFYSETNPYTYIPQTIAINIEEFNNVKDLINHIAGRSIEYAICVYDKDGAYESNAVLLLRESLKTQARFNEITTDDATILKNKFTKLDDLLNDILTKNGATILSLFNNIRVRNAFNQAESNAKLNTIIRTHHITTIDDFIYWVNDTNETTFLVEKQQQEQQQERERQDRQRQDQLLQYQHAQVIRDSQAAYDLLHPDETRDRDLITNTVLRDDVKYGYNVLNKKTNWGQLVGKFVILYIKKKTGDDQIAQGVIQAVDVNLDNTLEGLTIKDKKYRFLKDYVENPHNIMFNSLMFIPDTDVVKCGTTGCWWYGGKKKSKRRISRKYKKKTNRRVVFSRNKKRVRNL